MSVRLMKVRVAAVAMVTAATLVACGSTDDNGGESGEIHSREAASRSC